MAARTDVPHVPAQVEELWDKLVTDMPATSFDDSRIGQTLLPILEAEPKASIFLDHIKRHSKLYDLLMSDDTEHTLFVPVNNGWSTLKARYPVGDLNGGWSEVDEEDV